MQIDEPKGVGNKRNMDPILEEANPNNDSRMTGKFDPNQSQSGAHYMNDLATSQHNMLADMDNMKQPNTLRGNSITKSSNRRSNRRSGKTVQAPEQQNCCSNGKNCLIF